METSQLVQSLQTTLVTTLPSIGAALAILILGWFGAVIIRAALRHALGSLKLNQRITSDTEIKLNAEFLIASGAFWLIILLTLIGVFNALNMPVVSGPIETLLQNIAQYLPRLVGGTVLALIAWLLATLLRSFVNHAVSTRALDNRLLAAAGMSPFSKNLGNILFWLVILLFLPAIIGAYQITGLLDPLSKMIAKALEMLPNIFAAVVIGVIGWLLGRVLSHLSTATLAATGIDRVGENAGVSSGVKLSGFIGSVVMIAVFIPSLIAALDALKIETISRPASQMLGKMMNAVPQIIAALMILTLTFFIARFVAQLLKQFLANLGIDALPGKMGLEKLFSGQTRPSSLAATLLKFFAMLFAIVEAANQLEFTQVSNVVTMFIQFGGDVLLGCVIFMIGFWFSNLVYEGIRSGGSESMAGIARFAILGLILSMGLRAMGIADDIVNMAFAFTFGAVAVAVALSFGLGGREAAGRQMEHWLAQWRAKQKPDAGVEIITEVQGF